MAGQRPSDQPSKSTSLLLPPKQWNLSTLIPPVGVASALFWGLGNLAEHDLQAGHQPKLMLIHNLLPKAVANRGARFLAVNQPAINLVYGATNAVGAFAQGYALRGGAFSLFSAFSLALAPMMSKNNRLAMQVLDGKVAPSLEVAKKGLALQDWSSLYNLVAPVGLLTGLFSITKVAQSSPGVKLEHPKGNSFAEMQEGQPEGKRLFDVLRRNMSTEWSSFIHTVGNTGPFAKESAHSFRQAVNNLMHSGHEPKEPPEVHEEHKNPISRFLQPLTSGHFVPLSYAHATMGRVAFSAAAALAFFAVFPKARHAIREHSLYDDMLKKLGHSLPQKTSAMAGFGKGLDLLLLWGNLPGAFAGLFTKFNDWPLPLSSVYRTSGIAYGAAAVGSLLKFAGVKKLGPVYRDGMIGPYNGPTWVKIGAFIQGTSYFVNLLLKNMAGKPQGGAAPAQPVPAMGNAATAASSAGHPDYPASMGLTPTTTLIDVPLKSTPPQ
jgi:hypothetical protein